MNEALSSENAQGTLKKELAAGIGDDLNTAEDKTTKIIYWSRSFKKDVEAMVHRPSFWSMTENEMVLTQEAFRVGRRFLTDTGISWINPIGDFYMCFENRSKEQLLAEAQLEKAKKLIGHFNLGGPSDHKYKMSVYKPEKNRMNKYVNDLGIDMEDLLIIGFSILIDGNTDLFSPPTIDEAKQVKEVADSSLDGMRKSAEDQMKAMGRVVGTGYHEDSLYEESVKETMISVERAYPQAMEYFLSGVREMDVTKGQLME